MVISQLAYYAENHPPMCARCRRRVDEFYIERDVYNSTITLHARCHGRAWNYMISEDQLNVMTSDNLDLIWPREVFKEDKIERIGSTSARQRNILDMIPESSKINPFDTPQLEIPPAKRHSGDEIGQKLEKLVNWARNSGRHSGFYGLEFVESVYAQFKRKGSITEKQLAAVDRIMGGFRVDSDLARRHELDRQREQRERRQRDEEARLEAQQEAHHREREERERLREERRLENERNRLEKQRRKEQAKADKERFEREKSEIDARETVARLTMIGHRKIKT